MKLKMSPLSPKVIKKIFLVTVAVFVGYRYFRHLLLDTKTNTIVDPTSRPSGTVGSMVKKEDELEDLGANAGELVDMGDITETNGRR